MMVLWYIGLVFIVVYILLLVFLAVCVLIVLGADIMYGIKKWL